MAPNRRRYSSDPSERAKQLHAEGKIGGARFGRMGGRPKGSGKVRHRPGETVSSLIARAAQEDSSKILAVLEDAVRAGSTPHHRLQAAKVWLHTESREAGRAQTVSREQIEAAERAAIETMSKQQLAEILADKIAGNPMLASAVAARLERSRDALERP